MTVLRDWQTGEALVTAMAYFSAKGWTPATSSNFSFRSSSHPDALLVTRSGIDKGSASAADFILVSAADGQVLSEPRDVVPSAETALHRLIYRRTSANVVVHTHSVNSILMTPALAGAGELRFRGLEILKGLGHKTHLVEEIIPVFPNAQDMDGLAAEVERYWLGRGADDFRAFLLAGHGVYCWGRDVAEARRRAEVLEYLFEWKIKGGSDGGTLHSR